MTARGPLDASPPGSTPRHARRRGRRARRVAAAALVTLAVLVAGAGAGNGAVRPAATTTCPSARTPAGRAAALHDALAARRDVLGERLLALRRGPTYAAARRLLPPLWYAVGHGGRPLTLSGAYYLPFAYPFTVYGPQAFALHVADGSEIRTRRADGPGLTVFVGDGRERYGSCLARLRPPRLARGWLPVLRTGYLDARGARYAQESFAGRIPGIRSLVSFVRLRVDATHARGAAVVRFVASPGSGARLVADAAGERDGRGVVYRIRGIAVIHVAWVHARAGADIVPDGAVYDAARGAVSRFWEDALARGTSFEVPEQRVVDAERSLLVQQRSLAWRYSVGNPYEELSFAEALDAARVTAAYGHADVSEAILRLAVRRLPARYTNWRAGAVLVAAADIFRLTRDRALVDRITPALTTVLRRLEHQLRGPGSGLLDREPFSSDVTRLVIGLHGQATVWQGLLGMARVWSRLDDPRLAARATWAADRLERALRQAARASTRRLADGSLFVPAALGDRARPYAALTASRDGSYWNLVMPYVLASGLFDPDGPTARGIWRYMGAHGSRLLGLVRADAGRLYGRGPSAASGVDQVYGVNVARFLADADLPDQLVLSLYGMLAGAMTRDTFVSGEAATVAPLRAAQLGSMYLPPNSGTSTAFLETLRLALVHERRGPRGAPTGLDLAFSTPRAWLREGATIRVTGASTSFGPVSYVLSRRGDIVRVGLDAPPAPTLRLRLRLPAGTHVRRVAMSGRRVAFDAASGTIRFPPGARGTLELVVGLGP